ncbi:MAG: DNA repair protein RadC [Chloroflexi bacterium]|nr:MAG: DNA repair protein RadC [Chloroflexota bacterium]TMG45799.1 MAG: DNA repair protein RadC [Chloroflexota bacterium]
MVSGADEPGLLAALVGQRGDLSGLRALLAEGGIVERPAGDLRQAARRHGFRPAQVRRLLAVRELARRWHVPADTAAPTVTSPREALLQLQDLRTSPRECFSVLYLNTRNQPLACETVAVGGLNVAALQPREVFGPALTLGAAAVILAHNHPSGDPTPSPEDLAVTRHLQEAGRLLGVEVLDHLVVCAERFRSLREAGSL